MSTVISLDTNVSAARTIIQANSRAREKLKEANQAVFDAVRALAGQYNDPLAPTLFNATQADLDALANVSPSKLLAVMQTGVPIFQLRMTPELREMLTSPSPNSDTMLMMLLRTFESRIPLTSL